MWLWPRCYRSSGHKTDWKTALTENIVVLKTSLEQKSVTSNSSSTVLGCWMFSRVLIRVDDPSPQHASLTWFSPTLSCWSNHSLSQGVCFFSCFCALVCRLIDVDWLFIHAKNTQLSVYLQNSLVCHCLCIHRRWVNIRTPILFTTWH